MRRVRAVCRGGHRRRFAAIVAIFAPWLMPHDPFAQDLGHRYTPPTWLPGGSPAHLLGTDGLGRDYLSRLILGARISMLIGASTVVLSGLIGTTLGVLGGFSVGETDAVVMFIVSCRLAIPTDPGGADRGLACVGSSLWAGGAHHRACCYGSASPIVARATTRAGTRARLTWPRRGRAGCSRCRG